ncbi:hypothetical protein D3C72_1658630 [compost metagenome]
MIVALDGPDMQGDAARVSQHQAAVVVDAQPWHVAAQHVEDGVDGHEGQHGGEHLQQHQRGQRLRLEAELHARERIGASGRQQHGDGGAHAGHLDGIPQPQQHGEVRFDEGAVGRLVGHTQRQSPVLEADLGRYQTARGEIAWPQGDR